MVFYVPCFPGFQGVINPQNTLKTIAITVYIWPASQLSVVTRLPIPLFQKNDFGTLSKLSLQRLHVIYSRSLMAALTPYSVD
ncbi:hypothetical protein CEXT_512031 [Caerostris extrusa]|uniref:Uncharacterized protein n=1 Tax=Caerostris extrusa TaxID=172846 RepID=A0AAV4TT40_CAEEX|nr:hypothetical protein CEXT_512031 [Caerostris extrusa]